METALRHASVGVRCELVWTGVKCNFSSVQLHDQYVDGKLPISRVRVWNFTRIRRKTKKLGLSMILPWWQWPVTTHKKCELPLIFAAIRQAIRRWKALNLGSLNMQFQQDLIRVHCVTCITKPLPLWCWALLWGGSTLFQQYIYVHVYIYIYIFFFFLIKKEERERRLERGKNDHRNPAGNRTRDL